MLEINTDYFIEEENFEMVKSMYTNLYKKWKVVVLYSVSKLTVKITNINEKKKFHYILSHFIR